MPRDTKALMAEWLEKATEDDDLRAELHYMAGGGDVAGALEAFGHDLRFGTGGLRGIMGAGPARMNIYTVRKATQGLAQWLKAQREQRPVAIAYDSRVKSDLFAKETARVLAANGLFVWLYPRLMPTPALSFAVRALGCCAGVCITASHNPAAYNGYKVYGADGGQITDATALSIQKRIAGVDPFDGVRLVELEPSLDVGMIRMIREETVNAYLKAVLGQSMQGSVQPQPLSVVYTPLNGAGRECVLRTLENIGVTDVALVPQQAEPDGGFPTCPRPNPELPEAMELGIALADQTEADIVIATDPDCDRVGVVVRDNGAYHRLSGNEIGVLLLDYVCRRRESMGRMPKSPVAVKTIVTTNMALRAAEKYNVSVRQTLTGFKYIGEQVARLDAQGLADRFIFGFEESCGYLAGSYVRDKDGVLGCMLVCEMARDYKSRGLTLKKAMQQLYQRYGWYQNRLHSVEYAGPGADLEMQAMMRRLREAPPAEVDGVQVLARTDYLQPAPLPDALPPADVLEYQLAGGGRVFVRPSGTEPKVKLYIETVGQSRADAEKQNERLAKAMRRLMGLAPEPRPAKRAVGWFNPLAADAANARPMTQ